MEWLKRLSSAVDYIEDHLTDEISYEEAAKIACCSTYYFQRMFSCCRYLFIRLHPPPQNDPGCV